MTNSLKPRYPSRFESAMAHTLVRGAPKKQFRLKEENNRCKKGETMLNIQLGRFTN